MDQAKKENPISMTKANAAKATITIFNTRFACASSLFLCTSFRLLLFISLLFKFNSNKVKLKKPTIQKYSPIKFVFNRAINLYFSWLLLFFRRELHQISLDEAFQFTIHHAVYIRRLVVGTVILYTTIIEDITPNL